MLLSVRDEFRRFRTQHLPEISESLGTLRGTAAFVDATTASTGTFISEEEYTEPYLVYSVPVEPVRKLNFITDTFSTKKQVNHKRTRERLAKLDPTLAETYQECWQAVYSTTADPERAALWQMRQVTDHFFGLLVPDDASVRDSEYWKQKGKIGEAGWDKVTRKERIEYAASRISDSQRAKTLLAQVDHMVKMYDSLNRAHKRGRINIKKARTTLDEMQSLFEMWLDALHL